MISLKGGITSLPVIHSALLEPELLDRWSLANYGLLDSSMSNCPDLRSWVPPETGWLPSISTFSITISVCTMPSLLPASLLLTDPILPPLPYICLTGLLELYTFFLYPPYNPLSNGLLLGDPRSRMFCSLLFTDDSLMGRLLLGSMIRSYLFLFSKFYDPIRLDWSNFFG